MAVASASGLCPRPQTRPQCFVLGLGLESLASINITEFSTYQLQIVAWGMIQQVLKGSRGSVQVVVDMLCRVMTAGQLNITHITFNENILNTHLTITHIENILTITNTQQ